MFSKRAPDEVCKVVVDVLGLEVGPSYGRGSYADWLDITVTPQGLANVVHSGIGGHTEHPYTGLDGRDAPLLPAEKMELLRSITSVVVDVNARKVVRRGMPRSPVVGADTLFHQDPALAQTETIDGGSVPSMASMFVEAGKDDTSLVFMPKLEGAVVYVWKYNGVIRFSTRRTVDASMSRKGCGSNFRLLSEFWYAVGGPPLGAFFPDQTELDGEGVAYAFLIAHPALMLTSFVNVGRGYLVYLGAICAFTGDMIPSGSTRIKWEDVDNLYDPSLHPVRVDSGAVIESMDPVVMREDVGAKDNGEIIGIVSQDGEVDLIDAIDEALAAEDATTFAQMEYGAYVPFPPPSSQARAFPPRGEARASAMRCLFDARDDDDDGLPPIYTSPYFASYEEALQFMRFGFYDAESPRVDVDPVAPTREALVNISFFPLFNRGEPVIACLYKTYAAHDETLVKATSVTYQPSCHSWRLALAGNNPNFDRRVAELSGIAEKNLGFSYSFNPKLFHGVAKDFFSYAELCPPLNQRADELLSDENIKMNVMNTGGRAMVGIPEAIAPFGESGVETSRGLRMRWISILYALALSPQHQKETLNCVLSARTPRCVEAARAVSALLASGAVSAYTRSVYNVRVLADSTNSAIRDQRTRKFAPGVQLLVHCAMENRRTKPSELAKLAKHIDDFYFSDALYSMSKSAAAVIAVLSSCL